MNKMTAIKSRNFELFNILFCVCGKIFFYNKKLPLEFQKYMLKYLMNFESFLQEGEWWS